MISYKGNYVTLSQICSWLCSILKCEIWGKTIDLRNYWMEDEDNLPRNYPLVLERVFTCNTLYFYVRLRARKSNLTPVVKTKA